MLFLTSHEKGSPFNSSNELPQSLIMSQDDQFGAEEENGSAKGKITKYEEQRMKRIEEKKERMKAMGLHKMANSLMGSVHKKHQIDVKGKRKAGGDGDDEEYMPPQENEGVSSSSEEDEDQSYATRSRKSKKQNTTPKGKAHTKNLSSNSDYLEEFDDALMQAIALSLQDSAGVLDVGTKVSSQSSMAPAGDDVEKKATIQLQEAGKRKHKKRFTSRVQMSEDELILHFFQFDEAGKGGITVRDLYRIANAHDFTWTDKEMKDMIRVFDSDGDGKLSLDDFSKIVDQCNMRQRSENAA